MAGSHFLYYTNISNLLIIVLMALLLPFHARAPRAAWPSLPPWLETFRFAATAGILLTFTAFSLLLLPRMEANYLRSLDNILVHNLVPLLACLDFILFGNAPGKGKRGLLWGLLLPAAYFAFSIALTLSGARFYGGSAPYFFLDFKANGWFGAGEGNLGVFWWFLLILALQLFLSRLLLGFRSLAAKNRPPVSD